MDKKLKVGKLNSIGEEDDEGNFIEDNEEDGEIFEVDRVIDIRWVNEKKGKVEYRVRWKYYKPIDDTWEPPEHFEEESISLLNSFNEKYQQMQDELRNYMLERGKEVTTESIRHVNILSNEIDQITEKTTMKGGAENITAYHVRWLGYGKPDSTWESEKELVHAQDKIDMFLHKKRVQKGKRHMSRGKDLQDFVIPDHVRREQEREFYSAIESGKVQTAGKDLYSIVKSRRCNQQETQLNSPELKTKAQQSKGKNMTKQRKQHNGPRENPASREVSSIKIDQRITVKIEQQSKEEASIGEDSILAGLIPYDRDRVKRDTREQLKYTLILSNTEFCEASEKGDYDTIFASLNSEKIPDVDFTSLFLKASRRGQRDLALLLSTYVPNLSARDEWGDSALTIAAKLGDVCFAHYLLVLDVPIGECNSQGQAIRDIAIKFGQMHFVKFLQEYEKGNLTCGYNE